MGSTRVATFSRNDFVICVICTVYSTLLIYRWPSATLKCAQVNVKIVLEALICRRSVLFWGTLAPSGLICCRASGQVRQFNITGD